MPTNLALDDTLIQAAVQAGGHRSKKEAVTAALEAYVQQHRQRRILALFGTIDFDPGYNPKAGRTRGRR